MQVAKNFGKAIRRCLVCGYEGQMKTWLANYNFPQFCAETIKKEAKLCRFCGKDLVETENL